jgi:hypothetical protein
MTGLGMIISFLSAYHDDDMSFFAHVAQPTCGKDKKASIRGCETMPFQLVDADSA